MSVTDVPKYEQVKRSLVKEIQTGRWSPGSPFPSESQLLQRYKVSRPTLIRSLQEMVRDGYLYREQGRGTFVADPSKQAGANTVAIFISNDVAELLGDAREVQLRIINGVQSALGQGQQAMTVRQAEPNMIDQDTKWFLEQTKPGTALVIEPSFNSTLIRDLQDRGWNTWAINEPCPGCHSVYIDQDAAGYLAAKYLLDNGCKRIALLNGPPNTYWGFEARQQGYCRAILEAGLNIDKALIHAGQHAIDSEAGRTMFRELLDAGTKPDGVVGASDAKAMGAIAAAQEAGLSTPGDIRFVSIDNTLADRSDPPLSAVALPFGQLGEQAVVNASRVMKPNKDGVQMNMQVCLQPTLVER
jgi:GntR family transcriptional regulator, arabinose operon transcriptional repressor